MLVVKARCIKVEPYWNVNLTTLWIEELAEFIKVEPYWNVNIPLGSFALLGVFY